MEFASEQRVTEKIALLNNGDTSGYGDKAIPSWGDLQEIYESRWIKEKTKFQVELKANFFALVERFASGKQEVYTLTAPERREKLYAAAFRVGYY